MSRRSEEQMRLQVLEMLRMGPATTRQLQATLDLPHVAKQIAELRQRPGVDITVKRINTGSGTEARYTLIEYEVQQGLPDCDMCGRTFERARDSIAPGLREGYCWKHGWRPFKA